MSHDFDDYHGRGGHQGQRTHRRSLLKRVARQDRAEPPCLAAGDLAAAVARTTTAALEGWRQVIVVDIRSCAP